MDILQERLSSLKAGLLTWLDHLLRIQQKAENYEVLMKKIQIVLDEPEKHIQTSLPSSPQNIEKEENLCKVY